ncbi:Hypothetical protein D9617_17g047480 [Elsinoe fawcettii]|nr:Hypothetical protein D9617_17g047480 [Elsinoe fawcettii]
MPHTDRKKRKQHPGKLTTVQVDDEWATVTRSNNARSRHTNAANKIAPGPPRNVTGANVEDLRKAYEKRRAEFEVSGSRGKIKGWIDSCLAGDGGQRREIKKAVGLAIGSFTRRMDDRSLWQLAAFMVIAEDVKGAAREMAVVVKDPAFSTTDIKFLEGLGIEVIPDGAEGEMDEQTLLFMPFLEAVIEATLVVQAARCPIYISSGLEGAAAVLEGQHHDSIELDMAPEDKPASRQAIKHIRENYSSLEFPEVPSSGYAFTGLRIHHLQQSHD